MSWKDWGYTKRGMIVGFILGLLQFIIVPSYIIMTHNLLQTEILIGLFLHLLISGAIIIFCTFIGWFVGKIKLRNK